MPPSSWASHDSRSRPDLVKWVDFDRVECPKCGEKFVVSEAKPWAIAVRKLSLGHSVQGPDVVALRCGMHHPHIRVRFDRPFKLASV